MDDQSFIASIDKVAGNFAPRGWMFCEGQELPINRYQALFSLIGTTYGGNGTVTFKLPDMRPVDKDGKKQRWWELGQPSKCICVEGLFPMRD
jgi:microcystin-dependent protein